jgi:hypothetical protein
MKALHAAAYVSAAYAKPSGILTYSGAGGSSSVPLAARATSESVERLIVRLPAIHDEGAKVNDDDSLIDARGVAIGVDPREFRRI